MMKFVEMEPEIYLMTSEKHGLILNKNVQHQNFNIFAGKFWPVNRDGHLTKEIHVK